MKQLKIIQITILTILACFLGGIMIYGIAGNDFPVYFSFKNQHYEIDEEREFDLTNVESIEVKYDWHDNDIIIMESPSDKLILKEYSRGNNNSSPARVTNDNGILQIVKQGKLPSKFFSFQFYHGYTELYLPSDYYNALSVSTSSGSIRTETTLHSKAGFDFSATSGSIHLSNVSAAKIAVSTTSGNIRIGEMTAEAVDLSCSSGNLRADKLSADDFDASTTSGNIKIADITAPNVKITASSGNIKVESGQLAGSFKTTSGSISMTQLSLSDNLLLSASSGDIKVSMASLAPYTVDASTSSGNIVADGVREYHKKKMEWSVGDNPKHHLDISTTSGSISVESY